MRNLFFTILLLAFSINVNAQQAFHKKMILMGSRFDITIVDNDSIAAFKNIKFAIKEIQRIESVISSWDSNSQTSLVNKNAGIAPVEVCSELFDLIQRSIVISGITDGAFDISYASMDQLWKFDGSMKTMPSNSEIKKSIANVGYKDIVLNTDKNTVFLKNVGMKIGFGAIGKGYAADRVKELLINRGVKAGIINASGDMSTWGKTPENKEWTIAITNPLNKNKSFAILPISNKAVVTSGDYEKFVMFNGKRYSHIINPKTGYPASGIISVSVIANSAELADALATSIFVMGVDVGLNRINQIHDIDCIIIDEKGGIFTSSNISINDE